MSDKKIKGGKLKAYMAYKPINLWEGIFYNNSICKIIFLKFQVKQMGILCVIWQVFLENVLIWMTEKS